ncbi:hypothetical protein IFO70_08840 [Phormidium tenue FACHB-886]|nr:hypothetical protein [Phormidium tenue FACHB-886]
MFSSRHISALFTPNIFQNGLSRHEESWRIYTELLQWLASEKVSALVNWYITELDYDLAFSFWEIYQLGGDRPYRDACQAMQRLVKVCRLTPDILQDSGCYRLNFYDAVRLSCAVDRNVDAIITWEPDLFAAKEQEHDDLARNGYFDISLRTEMADDQTPTTHRIRVFSLASFFLYLQEPRQPQFWEERLLRQFRLEELKICTVEDGSEIQAIVTLRNPNELLVCATATSPTPCGAICEAIDHCIEQSIPLPPRRLIGLAIPNVRIEGARAAVEVQISVECERRILRASANHINMLQAFGYAYVDAINEIYQALKRQGTEG